MKRTYKPFFLAGILMLLGGCAVVPAQPAYGGYYAPAPAAAVVVRPAPYYAPAPYYTGWGHRAYFGFGHRHWR